MTESKVGGGLSTAVGMLIIEVSCNMGSYPACFCFYWTGIEAFHSRCKGQQLDSMPLIHHSDNAGRDMTCVRILDVFFVKFIANNDHLPLFLAALQSPRLVQYYLVVAGPFS